MSTRTVKYTLGILVLLVIGWDVFLYLDAVPENTISRVVLQLPDVVDFLGGVLCGHLFWPQTVRQKSNPHVVEKLDRIHYETRKMIADAREGGITSDDLLAHARKIRGIVQAQVPANHE